MSPFGTKRTPQHVQPMSAFGGKADIGWRTLLLHLCAAAVTAKTLPSAALAFHRVALPRAIAAPALVREVQPLRAGASANQPSFPAYARALINWLPSNPISNAFFSIHAFALGAWVSIPASANACSSRIASARSISMPKVTALVQPSHGSEKCLSQRSEAKLRHDLCRRDF